MTPPPVTPPAEGGFAGRRWIRLGLAGLAMVGALLGVLVFVGHLQTDPLADVRAYYDAGARLNEGLPLYDQPADTNEAGYYRYPPLLAILFRPLALLPYETAALIWGTLCGAAFVLTLWWLGLRRYEMWVLAGVLGIPIGWSLAIGQAQVPVTLFLAVGSPWAVAVAGNLKVIPFAVAVFWLGRREWRQLGLLIAWAAALLTVQFVLEPQATLDFFETFGLAQVGEVRNLSPYVISPILWLALVVAGALLALRLAPTRFGWAAAVTLSVLWPPRLLVYMLMTLLAGLGRDPGRPGPGPARGAPGSAAPRPRRWPPWRSQATPRGR